MAIPAAVLGAITLIVVALTTGNSGTNATLGTLVTFTLLVGIFAAVHITASDSQVHGWPWVLFALAAGLVGGAVFLNSFVAL